MDDIYVCKIPLENFPRESILFYSTWSGKGFSLKVYHKDRAWHKTVTEDDLKFLSGFTRNPVDEYLRETKRALSSEGGCVDFAYTFKESEFVWKKIVDSDNGIKVKFGSLLLDKIPVSSFTETVVNYMLDRCLIIEEKNRVMEKENGDLKSANSALRSHVCSITKMKTEMEESLYSKALAVLNAKKEKICELQELINTRPTASGTTLDSDHKTENVVKGLSPSKASDPYGSETEVDTDNSSDLDYSNIRANPSTSMTTRAQQEYEDSTPPASKSTKLDTLPLECSAKSSAENVEDDADEIFVPTRRKKSSKSVTCR